MEAELDDHVWSLGEEAKLLGWSWSKEKVEKKRSIMQFTGGMRYGLTSLFALNTGWPLVKLEVCADGLKLKSFTRNIDLKKEEISRLSKYTGLFLKGIRIEHSSKEYQPLIVFWARFKFEKVKSALLQNGYSFN